MTLKNWLLISRNKKLHYIESMLKYKSQVAFGLLFIVSVEVLSKSDFVASHALQQTNCGPKSKKGSEQALSQK